MTAALIVLGIVAYLVVAGSVYGRTLAAKRAALAAHREECRKCRGRYYGTCSEAPDPETAIFVAPFWPAFLPVAFGRWLARPRPKRDPDAELRELDERFAAELGITTSEDGP